MIVVWNEGRSRFEAITSYFERSIPKENRWRWDTASRRWYTASQDLAMRLAKYAEGAARLKLLGMSAEEQAGLDASQARDAAIEIPVPPGLEYLPYQRAGIAYALHQFAAGRGVLLADEMGLGKTVQAIGAVNMLPQTRRVLIVCPASLRLNWRAEWRRWHTGKLRPTLLDTWPMGLFGREAATDGMAAIVSYDSVQKWHPMIAATPWDLLVMDEAHLVKDAGTRRAKSLFGGNYKGRAFKPVAARHTLALSGTPIVNRPAELWPLVHALAPQGLGASKADFDERYCKGDRLAELHVRLRSQIMVRRLKADVLTELPPKRRQVVLLDLAEAEAIRSHERARLDEARRSYETARAQAAALPHAHAVFQLRNCRGIALSEISRIRHETAVKKLPAVIEHIRDVLGETEKVVAFVHHHDCFDRLIAEFGPLAVGLDGRSDEARRGEAVRRFQSDPAARIFVGSIKAAGLGLTLTAAATVIFAELDWTPAGMMQAEDRCHRIGQRDSVLVQHLVIDGSIDAKMAKILLEKQAVIDCALDGGEREQDRHDILDEVFR